MHPGTGRAKPTLATGTLLACLALSFGAAAQDAPAGSEIYNAQGCVGCHGQNGEGVEGVAPALAGNDRLGDARYVISQVLIGRGEMPAFADQLDNAEVAAVVDYIRTGFGNGFGTVQPSRVAEVRQSPSVDGEPPAEASAEGQDAQQQQAGQQQTDETRQARDGGAAGGQAEERPRDAGDRNRAQTADPDGPMTGPVGVETAANLGATPGELVQVPVVGLTPGGVRIDPGIENPAAGDPEAANRGMTYYNQFNCVGCHAPNGAGGMGPSLSNTTFLYGQEPANIYLTILQGRPKGMPAWGGMLPDNIIWDLVAYVRSIARDEPEGAWGRTTSLEAFTIEQVPAEYMTTTEPWQHTQPFSFGQPPFERVEGSPPLETPSR